MLRPQDTATRERKCLTGLWRFALDPDGVGRDRRWYAAPLPGDAEMPVPASFNDIVPDPAVRDYVGDVWYQTTVRVPRGWFGQRIVLHVESATHRATVWVGDAEVMSHAGGYTPFEADVSTHLRPGEPTRITVAVTNDVVGYAGLHRPVWLYRTGRVHLTDLTVVTDLSGNSGHVRYRTETHGRNGYLTRAVLRDAQGRQVAVAEGASGTLTVRNVRRWAPGDGYLYDLEVRLVTADNALLDSYHQKVGVRTVTVDGGRFLINGEPFRFTGFGTWADVPVLGEGHSDAFLAHDVALLEWTGANSFRAPHPYAEDVLDYADRRGLVVIDGTPGGPDGQAHARAIRELVARDKNHPCVVLWSIADAPASDAEGADKRLRPLFKLARSLDQTRPVGFVNGGAPPDRCRVSQYADVLLLDRPDGCPAPAGELAAGERAWGEELAAWAAVGKPIIVSGYGAGAHPGLHSVTALPGSEEYQVACLELNHRVFDRVPAVVGEQVSAFADGVTAGGLERVGGDRRGVFTRDRQPKAAAFALRRRWREDA